MRIAMIGHKRIPGREGGIEVVVEELATRMAAKGHSVTVYNRKKKGIKSQKYFNGVRMIDVPTLEHKSLNAVIYSFLASIRASFGKYDVIHFHAIGPSFFLLIPHMFGKRTVVTVHGLNYKTPKWKGIGAWFIKKGEVITAKYADEVIVLSLDQKHYFKEKYNRDVIYIPNGTTVYDREGPEIIRQKYGLENGKYILFLSRIVPGKGLEYLLDAYKKIDSDLPLVIAGKSEYAEEFYSSVQKKASQDHRVRFIGFVEGKELRELYSNAKLFVFPSEAEGMPLCLLEAMSFDCPCLVSNIPENLEVGEDFVQSFETQNANDLEEKLRMCLEHPEIFKEGSGKYIRKKYCWDSVVEQTLTCYFGKD